MRILIKRLDKSIPLPEFKHYGEDAGLDLRAGEDTFLPARGWKVVKTGIKIAIPNGYAGFIYPRSGLALKYGVTVLNADGVIDAGYRGEVGVILINHADSGIFQITKGDRIAQLIVQRVQNFEWEETEDLGETKRGEFGFGDSGVK